MAYIRVDSPIAMFNGQALTFKSPANCANITGLRVYYPYGDATASKVFQFADAHGNNVGGLDLFASNVVVKVILDVSNSLAFVQNADTNAYLEGELAKKYSPTNKPTAADIGARPSTWTPSASDVGAVPTSRTVNGKALSSNISLTASDVGAAESSHNHSASNITSGTLPVARGGTGNTSVDTTPTSGSTKMVTSGGVYTALAGKAASSHGNHVPTTQTADNATFLRNDNSWQKVTPANIGAAASSHTHTKSEITDFPTSMPASDVYSWAKASSKPTYTASEVGAVPTTRTVNGKALSSNISLTAEDVGASASTHNHRLDSLNPHAIEFVGAASHGGFIDFHFGQSANDYTSRLIENASGILSILKPGGKEKEILHMGNKPTGTYEGNGDAAERTIDTGGLGNVCVVTSDKGYAALVTAAGFFYSSGSTTVTFQNNNYAYFANGVLHLKTGSYVNTMNTTYVYQVL